MYKAVCGFKWKAKVCNFKEEDCTPEKCDFHDLEFNAKAIKERINKVEERQKELKKKYLKFSSLKSLMKKAKKGEIDEEGDEAKEIKKKGLEYIDNETGLKYLRDAYKFCKRARL